MSNLRWKVLTIIGVFVVFFAVGIYPLVAQRYNVHQPSWLVDKALKLLDWEPRIDLDEGLARTIGWYRERRPVQSLAPSA